MIFIVTGHGEAGPVSVTCNSATAALEKAHGLDEGGVRDLLIDAGGQEYAPADFNRLFIEPDLTDPQRPALDAESVDPY